MIDIHLMKKNEVFFFFGVKCVCHFQLDLHRWLIVYEVYKFFLFDIR